MSANQEGSTIERLRKQRDNNAANLARVSAVAGSMRASLTYIRKLLEKPRVTAYDHQEILNEIDQTLKRCDSGMNAIERNTDEGISARNLPGPAATRMDSEDPH